MIRKGVTAIMPGHVLAAGGTGRSQLYRRFRDKYALMRDVIEMRARAPATAAAAT